MNITKNSSVNGSKKDYIQEQLINLIQSNKYIAGDKLPSERELAALFNISRNVLREALVSLTAKGIIEARERQGIFVKNMVDYSTTDSLQNLQMLPVELVSHQMEARIIISVPAARLAAERRTEEDLKKLWDCYTNFVNCPYTTKEEQIQNSKWEALLHYLVVEAAHNPIISRINESVNAFVERNNAMVHPALASEAGWIIHIQDHHKKIITAIENKDPVLAGDVLKQHMIESIQMIEKNYPQITISHSLFSQPI